MTHALADEMRKEVEDLLSRVQAQEREPGVRGVTHVGRLVGSIGTTATLATEKLTKESSGPEGD
jgi:hypothetical protein